ncbi:radical SAM family heme chaperone HemW [Chenggangzhangella methanolivorans]|uniref:Heme chaperone HemW n=1 Tax=Chenggangzhangella methanolivorans TaxID=1437009 RepID=A0A9E6R7E2_9HYPH|nr:radical SAM family heme chaperone HemW [Chenggangzhangella methanolivorans]QZN98796.1 radical SAM family heme chaperone HemW [Chenggangzhangella methanolivorans]
MTEPGFGVYVHWPFCASKCPYCDFNSHVRHRGWDEPRFLSAFRREIAHMAALAPGRTVSSIFFGGGTPSLMQPETVGGILDAIAENWEVDDAVEVTLEANPTSVEADRFRGYRAAGVGRVSLGVQSLVQEDLTRLGRLHTVEEAMAALDVATEIFPRVSFDLIYARPDQTPQMWKKELSEALARGTEHLSLYQLTIEEGTPYYELHKAGKLKTPDEATGRALWDVTQETCAEAGLPAYEISNHARPGSESRHNLVYWRYGEYAGVGPGAHGRLVVDGTRRELSTERNPELWASAVEADGSGLVMDAALSLEAQGDEFLLMGLRLTEGIDLARFIAISGRRIDDRRIDDLIMDGMVERVGKTRLRVTPEGLPVLDAVVADLAS